LLTCHSSKAQKCTVELVWDSGKWPMMALRTAATSWLLLFIIKIEECCCNFWLVSCKLIRLPN
jgi:hypothetical protein